MISIGGRELTPIEQQFVEANIRFYEEGLSVNQMFELAYAVQRESKLRRGLAATINIQEKNKK